MSEAVALSPSESELLAMYVVAMNARAWEIEWEDFPYLDEDSVNVLNDAIVDVGVWLARLVDKEEHHRAIDVRDLFSRVTA